MALPMPMPMQPPPAAGGGMPVPPGAAGGVPMPPGIAAGAQNPLAALSQRGAGGGLPDPMMMFLTFSAGVGFKELVKAINDMKNPPKHSGGKGVGADANRAPMQSIPPQLAQMLAARQGGPQAPAAQALGALR